MFNEIIEAILVAFKMKKSRACNGMLSSENLDIKLVKTAKNTKRTCITCTIVAELVECFTSPNQSFVYQKHSHKSSHRAALYIFENIEI